MTNRDPRYDLQERAYSVCRRVFGTDNASSYLIRGTRFLEEAIELAQAEGVGRERAHKLVDYIYSRPTGFTDQEIGGVMMTLAVLCENRGYSLLGCLEHELGRIERKHSEDPAHFTRRNKAKDDAGFGEEPSHD